MIQSLVATPQKDVNSAGVRLSAVLCGGCFILFYCIMPIVLGRAANSLGLVESQMGLMGGSFAAGVALASLVSVLWVRRLNWRRIVRVSGLALGADYLLMVFVVDFPLLLSASFLAGVMAGTGYAVVIACLGDTREPARNYALAILCQTLIGALISYSLPRLVGESDGFVFTLLLLAAFGFCTVPLASFLPTHGVKLHTNASPGSITPHSRAIPLMVLASLAVIGFSFTGYGALWAFIETIAKTAGLSAEMAGTAVAVSLLTGALGSASASVLSTRMGYGLPMTVAIAFSMISVFILQAEPSIALFVTAIGLNGWGWNFGAAYCMGLVAELDISGRFTPMISGMQTLGGAVGPVVAGLLVINSVFLYVYIFVCSLWLIALLLFFAVLRYRAVVSSDDVKIDDAPAESELLI